MVCLDNESYGQYDPEDPILSFFNCLEPYSPTATSQVKHHVNSFLSFANSPTFVASNIDPESADIFRDYDGSVVPKSDGDDELFSEVMTIDHDLNFEQELGGFGEQMDECDPETAHQSPDFVPSPVAKKARLHSTMAVKSEFEGPAPAGTIIKVPKSVADPAESKPILYMTEGIDIDETHKYLGGKNNSQHYLPLQVIELNHDALPLAIRKEGMQFLTCRAMVMGFDKQSKDMKVLGELSCDKPFLFDKKKGKWTVKFEDILIQFASHNYGQRLAIKFQLIEKGKLVLYEFTTKVFQTITKRGLEKEQVREHTRAARAPLSVLCLERVEPPVGATSGGQLVKLIFSGALAAVAVETISIKFGTREATMIHCSKNNELICETPALPVPGPVDIKVEIVKKDVRTPVSSIARFNYLDPKHPDTPRLVLNHFFSKLSL
jgi:hypothetical protein